jgi:hypothetical protein
VSQIISTEESQATESIEVSRRVVLSTALSPSHQMTMISTEQVTAGIDSNNSVILATMKAVLLALASEINRCKDIPGAP